jgi:hypothetical protein
VSGRVPFTLLEDRFTKLRPRSSFQYHRASRPYRMVDDKRASLTLGQIASEIKQGGDNRFRVAGEVRCWAKTQQTSRRQRRATPYRLSSQQLGELNARSNGTPTLYASRTPR